MKRKKPLPPALALMCGCEVPFIDGDSPVCARHGRQRVVRVMRMPPPRFVGAVSGPHAQTSELGAFVGKFKSRKELSGL